MKISYLLTAASAIVLVAACSQQEAPTTSAAVSETPAQAETIEATTEFDASVLEAINGGTYKLDPNHAFLTFKVGHNGGISRYEGRFTDFDVTLDLDTDTVESSALSVSIDPTAVFVNFLGDYKATHAATGYESWTEDLTMSPNWLNAGEFGSIAFESTGIERTGNDTGVITGDLTFLGVTKPVDLDVTFRGVTAARGGNGDIVGFDAITTIKRSDFGNSSYIPIIGDDVVVEFSGELGQVQ